MTIKVIFFFKHSPFPVGLQGRPSEEVQRDDEEYVESVGIGPGKRSANFGGFGIEKKNEGEDL